MKLNRPVYTMPEMQLSPAYLAECMDKAEKVEKLKQTRKASG